MIEPGRIAILTLGLLLAACDADQGDDDSTDPGDDDDDAGDDDDTTEDASGLLGRVGTATVDGASYQGTEDLYFTTEYGEGEDVCRIRYPLSSSAVRDDCADCVWAFDLVLGAPELIAETDPGCLATVGVDSASLGDVEGDVVSYGYDPEYFGHIQMLLVEQAGSWAAVGHADWESGSGAFSYDWEDGYHTY